MTYFFVNGGEMSHYDFPDRLLFEGGVLGISCRQQKRE